jgi:hypothetical protein
MSDTGTVLSVRYLMAKEATMSTSAILPISSVDFAESGNAASAAAPSSGAVATTSATTVDTTPTANTIAEGLILSQIQLSLITALLSSSAPKSTAASNSDGSLTSLLNEAYPGSGSSATANSENSSATSPYEALVQAIQSSLATGAGMADASLAYLNSTGNFVRTSA